MIHYLVEKEYQELVDAYEKAGGDKSALLSGDTASLVVQEDRQNRYIICSYSRQRN